MKKMKMLKPKYIFMLGSNMCSIKKLLVFLLFLVGNYTLVFSQRSKKIYIPKSTYEVSVPYLPHAIVTNGKQGYSFVYSYPGYFSYWGQASLYYTNSLGDSYFGSVGEVYIMVGVNKKIIKISKSIVYFNANVGTFGIGNLGSFGISYLQQLTPKNRIELVFDAYLNHGVDADMMAHGKTYSKGFLAGVNFAFDITPDLLLNFGVALSTIRYRYIYMPDTIYENSSRVHRYEYIPKSMEKYSDDNDLYWDSHFLIPLGITLSYHF